MSRMSFVDFNELRDVGVFRDDVQYERGMLIAPDGTRCLPALTIRRAVLPSRQRAWANDCAMECW